MAAVPKDGAYALQFPDGFSPKVAVKFDENHPDLPLWREFARKQNWDQATFSEALALKAQEFALLAKAHQDHLAAEKQKLGAQGPARVTAVKTWLKGMIGDDGADEILGTDKSIGLIETAKVFEYFEKMQAAYATQGAAPMNGKGRDTAPPPQKKTLAESMWPSMSGTKG